MDVGIMPLAPPRAQVNVPVRVRLTRRLRAVMGMLMVFVVHMAVFVRELLVFMVMRVAFRQMDVDTDRHQLTGRQQPDRDGFPEPRRGSTRLTP
jgi:hypothetical protein